MKHPIKIDNGPVTDFIATPSKLTWSGIMGLHSAIHFRTERLSERSLSAENFTLSRLARYLQRPDIFFRISLSESLQFRISSYPCCQSIRFGVRRHKSVRQRQRGDGEGETRSEKGIGGYFFQRPFAERRSTAYLRTAWVGTFPSVEDGSRSHRFVSSKEKSCLWNCEM